MCICTFYYGSKLRMRLISPNNIFSIDTCIFIYCNKLIISNLKYITLNQIGTKFKILNK